MSDVTIAIVIVPVMAALVLVLECSRIGCSGLKRRMQKTRTSVR